jgi:hypothetical protein
MHLVYYRVHEWIQHGKMLLYELVEYWMGMVHILIEVHSEMRVFLAFYERTFYIIVIFENKSYLLHGIYMIFDFYC